MIIQTEIRPATTHDLLHAPGLLKIGIPYYIKHPKTHQLSGPYMIDQYHNSQTMAQYYNDKCIYVPVVPFDIDIANNLQQQDLKTMVANGDHLKTKIHDNTM